jgi:hypothetical protein
MKFFRITGLLMLYLLLSSKGCDDREPKSQEQVDSATEITQDSIITKFSSEILPAASLRAFEENAKQKLIDFADYFNIIHDTSLDTSFRNQATKMIKDLFYNENIQLDLTFPGMPESKKVTLEEVLNHSFFQGHGKSGLIIDSVHVIDPFHLSESSWYAGKLSFRQGFKTQSGKDSIVTNPGWKTVSIIAARHPKRFGNDTKEVWEVFLGQIQNRKM